MKSILLQYHTWQSKLDFFATYIHKAHEKGITVLIVFPTKAHLQQYRESLGIDLTALINTTLFLGLRSSVVASYPNLARQNFATQNLGGLATVIIDDEQHPLYREQRSPHADATMIAFERWHNSATQLIFASYAPSLIRYHMARGGALDYIERGGVTPHHATLIDMRTEAKCTISMALQREIQNTLTQHKKVLLFLNRRGLATIVICSDCKKVCTCPHCEVPTVFHKMTRTLSCHHCEFQEPLPLFCTSCKNPDLQLRGKGTEKVVEEIQQLFTHAKVARIDLDNPSFSAREADSEGKPLPDIIIGTQMLFTSIPTQLLAATGLIGIISADTALNLPLLNAPERTFQLLMQSMMLSASYDIPLMVQTLLPEHYAIIHAIHADTAGFYEQELNMRKQFMYPPYSHLIKLSALYKTSSKGEQHAEKLYEHLTSYQLPPTSLPTILPPRLHDQKVRAHYQWSILIKSPVKADHPHIHELLAKVPLEWNIEVDPALL